MMNKPTLEQYEKAKKDYDTYCTWLGISRREQSSLIDSLAVERSHELRYLEQAEKCREIIVAYEIYEQAENGKR